MTAQARIDMMPDWPARLGEDLAALYLGISPSAFREGVARGRYPQPVREGKRKLWARGQLDRFVAAQFGFPYDGDSAAGGDPTWDDLR